MTVTPAERKAAKEYRDFLREMKRRNLKMDDIPEELQGSLLALHQNALNVYWEDRKDKKSK